MTTRARSKYFILCLCMKALRSRQAKVYFAYFEQRDHDQPGKIAKHLTARKVLYYGDVFLAAAVVAS